MGLQMSNWAKRGKYNSHKPPPTTKIQIWSAALAPKSRQIAFDFSDILYRALARVAASVTAPYPDRKFDGIFNITTELSPLASPAFEAGR